MQERVILDLCGGTGAWSEPYRKAGYTVHNITLPEYDVTTAHVFHGMASDSIEHAIGSRYEMLHIGGKKNLNLPIASIHGILAAPPCTEFSIAKNGHHRGRDYTAGMKVVRACLDIIWLCRAFPESHLKWWALENPRGYLRHFLGVPHFTYEQWQYGILDQIKPTDIWGYFKEPARTTHKRPDMFLNLGNRGHAASWTNIKKPKEYFHLKLSRADIRAITPPGFAKAFFKANP